LEQAIDRYKKSDSFLVLSENTRSGYTADLVQFQEYCRTQDISSVRQVESEDIRNWHHQLRQTGRAPATINRKRASLSGFLDWAQAEGIIRPDFKKSLPKYEPIGKKRPGILSAEQVGKLISNARDLRDASLILITLATDARISEILDLNAEDVFSTKEGNHVVSFKRRKSPRTLAIDKKIGDVITEYKKNNGLKHGDPLFQGYYTRNRGRLTGCRLTRQAVDLMLKRYYGPMIGVVDLNHRMLRNGFYKQTFRNSASTS